MISRSNVQRTVKTFDFYTGKTKAKRTGHFESLWQMNLHNLQDGKDQILSSKIWIRQVRNKLILVRNFPIWRDVCHKKSQYYTTRNSIIRPNDSGKAPPFSLVVSLLPAENIGVGAYHFEQIITRIAAKNGYFTDESSLNLHILPNILYESAMPNGNLPGGYIYLIRRFVV